MKGGIQVKDFFAAGFFNAGVESARGNQGMQGLANLVFKYYQYSMPKSPGMKDQVLPFRWVRQYRTFLRGRGQRSFTILGESAGGISVSLLTVSSMAKGLLGGAIMISLLVISG